MKFPVSAKLVISAKMDVEFIFDLFLMKTMVIGTNYIPYHLNVVSVQLVGFGFRQVQTGAMLDVLSYLSLLKCCRKLVLVPSFRLFNTNHPLMV